VAEPVGALPAASSTLAVPPDFAWISNLGQPLVVARVGRASGLILGPALVASTLIVAFLLAALVGDALNLPDMATFAITLVVVGATMGLVGYWFGARVGGAVVLYESGVAIRDSRRIRAWAWDDILGVKVERKKVEPGVPTEAPVAAFLLGVWAAMKVFKIRRREVIEYAITLRDRAGGTGTIDRWFNDAQTIGDVIEREVTGRVGPRLADVYGQNQWVYFGAVAVHRTEGIRAFEKAARWEEVDHLRVERGYLKVLLRNGKELASVPVQLLENIRVLLALMAHVS